ncbi:hypothetical protein [Grimontia hollisae]|uniref:hypothetical protein n=1 Tax=Grimontia hollisae TaxID=673 RepID=UPI00130399FF|nr:hypothetical protein [Grimontia hollisae]
MKARMDPLTVVIVSILLGWGWTKLTHEPVCQKHIIKDGVTYEMPVYCDTIPDDTL